MTGYTLPVGSHTYAGDSSSYAVDIVRRNAGTVTVRILAATAGPGTIPLGAVVTVPARRVAREATS